MNLAEWTFGCLKCPITGVWLQPTVHLPFTPSNHSCTEGLVKNKAANTPITFEEMVMVMIRLIAFKNEDDVYNTLRFCKQKCVQFMGLLLGLLKW